MKYKQKLALSLFVLLALMGTLIGYRIYLIVNEKDYGNLNGENLSRIESSLGDSSDFSFAVVGNIQNSMRLFEQRIIPLVEGEDVDFMLSLGNAVYDGAEGKYRLLNRGLNKLHMPKVMIVGKNEVEDFGSSLFYRHFGPYFFSFTQGPAFFLVIDTSHQTSWEWQIPWIEEELKRASTYHYRFVFMNGAMFTIEQLELVHQKLLLDQSLRDRLHGLFVAYGVSSVFSAGYRGYSQTERDGIQYINSGAGGGLLLHNDSQYQIVKVQVGQGGVSYTNVPSPTAPSRISERFERLKLYLYSFVYMGIFNMLVLLTIIGLIALWLYVLIIRQEHLYRDFSIDEEAEQKELSVVMFTNNYLPFIGGVPISIQRLSSGLRNLGHDVHIFAPTYPDPSPNDEAEQVYRCPRLFHANLSGFIITNLFSSKISHTFKALECDLVHIHHPFWLGVKGLHLARRRHLPIILTYHTRLERYMHYLPIPGMPLKHLLAHLRIKHVANHCDAIITPTPSTEEYLRNLGVRALIETIPTGIKLEAYSQWSDEEVLAVRRTYANDDQLLLISVARLAEEKNLDFLLAALAKTKALVPPSHFKCILVGDGPEREHLERQVDLLGLQDTIVFTGNLPPSEVAKAYRAADLFVFASTSETQGMVLVEAMAGGCPVVAVRASGVHDVLENGYNGLMVAESTESWANAVRSLLMDPQRLAKLSENSMLFAQTYSVENIAKKVEALYQRVVLLHQEKQL